MTVSRKGFNNNRGPLTYFGDLTTSMRARDPELLYRQCGISRGLSIRLSASVVTRSSPTSTSGWFTSTSKKTLPV
jgi:hypothetical protein